MSMRRLACIADRNVQRARPRLALLGACLLALPACAVPERRFSLRPPLWRDSDMAPVAADCHLRPTKTDPHHRSCAPAVYESSLIWDGADSVAFRPLSETLRISTSGEAVNVNSLDEVPDSAWFTNRLGVRAVSADELRLGGCAPDQLLDPADFADGAWTIEAGKMGGETRGFRVLVPGRGRYLFKGGAHSEGPSAAAVIGLAVYHAVGFATSCEQAVRFRPSLLTLRPGLRAKMIFQKERALDGPFLQALLADCALGDGTVRMSASAWLPGYLIGSFRYEGVRPDDRNDVIPHEDRRELRASRLLAAWINHFDTREGNTLDTWIAAQPGAADASPGYVRHYHIDTSESLSTDGWGLDELSRRIGHAYVVDWAAASVDFVSLGARVRPWDPIRPAQSHPTFGYYDVAHFDAQDWKNEYPNPAFSRMTERDAAWMARILARFTPEMVRTLAEMGQFRDPAVTAYLAGVLEGRLVRILERYLTRLSPIADLHIEGPARDQLCGIDLAAHRRLRPPEQFHFAARVAGGGGLVAVARGDAEVCVTLAHHAVDGGAADDAPTRYLRVVLTDAVARGELTAHLYDLGPARGFVLAGLER